jgi:3-deoxy-7-phosphoheptulonate synthase
VIIVTRAGVTDAELDHIRERIETLGMRTHLSRGEHRTIIGCIGDETLLQEVSLLTLPGVESVVPVLKPYKLAAREFAADRTVVRVGRQAAASIGGQQLAVIAGPCSVEGREMLHETARAVRAAGAGLLRGGAFKPRTSPYAFQGMGAAGLALLAEVRAESGLPVVSEVMDTRQVELVAEHVDVLQVGARNMQNFALLAEVGRAQRPVLLKRGLSATVRELLMAAEYVMAQGNRDVVLCERGIRTFETATRNTLDVAAIPVLKAETRRRARGAGRAARLRRSCRRGRRADRRGPPTPGPGAVGRRSVAGVRRVRAADAATRAVRGRRRADAPGRDYRLTGDRSMTNDRAPIEGDAT